MITIADRKNSYVVENSNLNLYLIGTISISGNNKITHFDGKIYTLDYLPVEDFYFDLEDSYLIITDNQEVIKIFEDTVNLLKQMINEL